MVQWSYLNFRPCLLQLKTLEINLFIHSNDSKLLHVHCWDSLMWVKIQVSVDTKNFHSNEAMFGFMHTHAFDIIPSSVIPLSSAEIDWKLPMFVLYGFTLRHHELGLSLCMTTLTKQMKSHSFLNLLSANRPHTRLSPKRTRFIYIFNSTSCHCSDLLTSFSPISHLNIPEDGGRLKINMPSYR